MASRDKGSFKRRLTKDYGKILDTDTIWIDRRECPVELRLLKTKDAWSATPSFKYTMLHIIDEASADIKYVQGDDPKKLHKELTEILEKTYMVTWTDMICVTVSKPSVGSRRESTSESIGIEFHRYQAGVRKIDGSKCWQSMRYHNAFRDEEACWKPEGRIQEAESPVPDKTRRCHWDSKEEESGVVEYTEENWKKLTAICEAIEALRNKAVSVLTGDALAKQLASMTVSGFLLPTAEEKEELEFD